MTVDAPPVAPPARSPPPDAPEALIEEARARQGRRRLGFAVAALLLLGLVGGLYLGFAGGASRAPKLQVHRVPGAAATVRGGNVRVYRVSGIGLLELPGGYLKSEIELRYPSSWYVTNRPLDTITNPVQMFVLSSYRVTGGQLNVDGPDTPPTPSPTGVIARLLEDQPLPSNAGSGPARPLRFSLPRFTPHMEGYNGRWGAISFVDHRIPFTLFISVGHRAPSVLVAQFLRILDGMTITITTHG
jgi:hypothetical protein